MSVQTMNIVIGGRYGFIRNTDTLLLYRIIKTDRKIIKTDRKNEGCFEGHNCVNMTTWMK